MAEPKITLPGKRKKLPQNQAIAVMVLGLILLAQVFFFSSEPGSSAQLTRIIIAAIGLVVLFVGAYLRPEKADAGGK
jgi:protein-S-isoprenylcysteine O-methyltransferase Ste14